MKHISTSKVLKADGFGPLLAFRCGFAWQGQGIVHLAKRAKREGFVAVSKTMAGMGHLRGIWKHAVRVACAVQETCSSEMLGQSGF